MRHSRLYWPRRFRTAFYRAYWAQWKLGRCDLCYGRWYHLWYRLVRKARHPFEPLAWLEWRASSPQVAALKRVFQESAWETGGDQPVTSVGSSPRDVLRCLGDPQPRLRSETLAKASAAYLEAREAR